MSAAPKILEGTWEEIAQHAQELRGHRLKVEVMDGGATALAEPAARLMTPEEWAAWFRDWALNRPPIQNIADDSRDAIYEDFLG